MHQTAREYLQTSPLLPENDTQFLSMGIICFRYISIYINSSPAQIVPHTQSWTENDVKNYAEYLNKFAFLDYALNHLKQHIADSREELLQDLAKLLKQSRRSSTSHRFLDDWALSSIGPERLRFRADSKLKVRDIRSKIFFHATENSLLKTASAILAMNTAKNARGSFSLEDAYRQQLGYLVTKADIAMLSLFLKKGVDKEIVGCFTELSGGGSENIIQGTALQLAVYTGNVGLTLWLLEHGVHANGKNQENNLTALHLATAKRLNDITGILLTHGADIESLNDLGETPLQKAASSGHRDIVQLLLDNKANTEVIDEFGRTPLHTVALFRHRDTVQLLLDNKANTEAVDGSGKTPLHKASSSGHRDIVQLLLDYRANIAAINNHEHRSGYLNIPNYQFQKLSKTNALELHRTRRFRKQIRRWIRSRSLQSQRSWRRS
jgi:hypothetical protein